VSGQESGLAFTTKLEVVVVEFWIFRSDILSRGRIVEIKNCEGVLVKVLVLDRGDGEHWE
jgi:hypothetical protein